MVSGAWLTRVMTRGPGPGHVCVVIRLNQEPRDLYSSVLPIEFSNLDTETQYYGFRLYFIGTVQQYSQAQDGHCLIFVEIIRIPWPMPC